MVTLGLVFCGAGALIHVFIFYLESVVWTGAQARAVFGIRTLEEAQTLQLLAFNQGFYNLFLALEVGLGIAFWLGGQSVAGLTLLLVGAGSMVAASLVLLWSAPGKSAAALKQGLLPLLGVLALTVGRALL